MYSHRVLADTDTDSELSHSECLSCDYDEDCQFVRASFSHSTKYYIMGCHGPAIPYFVLRSTIRNQPLGEFNIIRVRTALENPGKPWNLKIKLQALENPGI